MRAWGATRTILVAVVVVSMVATSCSSSDDDTSRPAWTPQPVTIDGLTVVAESDATGFRLHTTSGDKTFLPGMNLGSTVPTRQPGEIDVLTAQDYRRWFAHMGELGIRVVRIYTVHPPA